MALEDLQAYPVLQATLMPTLSPHIPQLYDSGGPPGLVSPPSNPYAHSSPTHPITPWLWRTSRPTQPSKQPKWPLYPLKYHNSMALEDLHPSPVLQATLMPTLAPHTLQLYGPGGPPGLPSPPSNPCGHSIPSSATTLWLWRTPTPPQSPQQPLWPLYSLKCCNSMVLENFRLWAGEW